MNRSVPDLIDRVNATRRRIIESTSGLSSGQARNRPAVTEWSVCETIEHLVLAERMGVTGLWIELERVDGGGTPWPDERPNNGLDFEQIAERTFRVYDTLEAPDLVRPIVNGPLRLHLAQLKGCQAILEAFGVALHDVDPADVVFPHFVAGPLDALQRLQFLEWHLDHHLDQILATRNLLDA